MSETLEKKEHGHARPTGIWGFLCCLCVCATIALVAYFLVQRPRPQPRRLWSPVVVETNGNQTTILGETRQLEFWTPSADTKDYLRKEGGKVIDSEKWEMLTNNDAVFQFGIMLRSNVSVLGYRRVEVWGHGRTGLKPGWWWTVDVLANYSVGNLASAYEAFWKSHQLMFVEVIDNRGRDE